MNWPWNQEEAAAVVVETEAESIERQYQESKAAYNAASQDAVWYEQNHAVPSSIHILNGKVYRAMNGRTDPTAKMLRDRKEHARQAFIAALRTRAEMRARMGLVR